MSTQKPKAQLETEVRCLFRALTPMDDDEPSKWFAKLMTLGLFAVWVVVLLQLTAADPQGWAFVSLTAMLFLIIGRLWDIEIEKIGLPGLFDGTNTEAPSTDDDSQD